MSSNSVPTFCLHFCRWHRTHGTRGGGRRGHGAAGWLRGDGDAMLRGWRNGRLERVRGRRAWRSGGRARCEWTLEMCCLWPCRGASSAESMRRRPVLCLATLGAIVAGRWCCCCLRAGSRLGGPVCGGMHVGHVCLEIVERGGACMHTCALVPGLAVHYVGARFGTCFAWLP
eukprot:2522859-Prymnesium_polylepis.1